MTFVLTGLNQAGEGSVGRSRRCSPASAANDQFDEVDVRFVAAPSDAAGQEASSGRLHVTVKSADERLVGRAFSSAASSWRWPTIRASSCRRLPPTRSRSASTGPPSCRTRRSTRSSCLTDGSRIAVERSSVVADSSPPDAGPRSSATPQPVGPSAGEPLGQYFGARSGDKGGNANVGVWAIDGAGYAWLAEHLSAECDRPPDPRGARVWRSVATSCPTCSHSTS